MKKRNPHGSLGGGALEVPDSSRQEDDILDLCTTCNYMELCVRKKSLKRPIYYCEEFDISAPPTPPRPVAVRPPVKAAPGSSAEPETMAEPDGKEVYTGICVNCDYRKECVRSRSEGGIWHCEEYA